MLLIQIRDGQGFSHVQVCVHGGIAAGRGATGTRGSEDRCTRAAGFLAGFAVAASAGPQHIASAKPTAVRAWNMASSSNRSNTQEGAKYAALVIVSC